MAQQALQSNPSAPSDRFDWLVALGGIIAAPSATFARLADAQPWRQGAILFVVVSAIRALLNLAEPAMVPPATDDPQVAGVMDLFSSPYFWVLTDILFAPLMFLAVTGIIYQIGLRQGGDGPFTRLFTTEVFSAALIALVSIPIDFLGMLLAGSGGGIATISFGTISFAWAVWSLVLGILSVRVSMRLSTGSSIVVVIASIVAVLIFSWLLFTVVGGIVVNMLS
jgi:hypothetical protein